MRLGGEHTVNLVEAVGHDLCNLLVAAHPDEGDQIDLAGDRVDLADALERGDLLGDLGDSVDRGGHEHDRGDHLAEPMPRTHSPSSTARDTTRARLATIVR